MGEVVAWPVVARPSGSRLDPPVVVDLSPGFDKQSVRERILRSSIKDAIAVGCDEMVKRVCQETLDAIEYFEKGGT